MDAVASSGESIRKEEESNTNSIIKAVSELLSEIITENKAEAAKLAKETEKPQKKSPFTSKKPPAISILAYFERILKYTKIEESTLILTLIYIDRICDLSHTQLTELNIHRIILATVLLAIKYNEDDYYSNDYYAKVGGISLQEINTLELEAILLLKHTLFVDEDFFNKYKIYLKHYLK